MISKAIKKINPLTNFLSETSRVLYENDYIDMFLSIDNVTDNRLRNQHTYFFAQWENRSCDKLFSSDFLSLLSESRRDVWWQRLYNY